MTAQITFLALVQDINDYNKAEHGEKQMVSRIVFSLELDGSRHDQLFVEVAQPMGTDYKTEPLTFGPLSHEVTGGPWNHEAFTELVEGYYRSALKKTVEVASARMRNNMIIQVAIYEFDIETDWSPAL